MMRKFRCRCLINIGAKDMEENPFKSPEEVVDAQIEYIESKKQSKTYAKELGIALGVILLLVICCICFIFGHTRSMEKTEQKHEQQKLVLEQSNQNFKTQVQTLVQGFMVFLIHTNVSSITLTNTGGFQLKIDTKKIYDNSWTWVAGSDYVEGVKAVKLQSIVSTNVTILPAKPTRLKSSFNR